MGYLKQTMTGLSWVGLLRGFSRFFGLIRTLILARLLTPTQFGAFGIAAILLAFLEMLTETGINVVLIQEDSDFKQYINTAYTVSLIRGLLIGLFIILMSPLIIQFFNAPSAKPLIYLIAIVPIIRGAINPSLVKLQKELQFKKEFWFRNVITLIDSLVAISTALIFRSPESLIYGLIAGALSEVILSHLFLKPKPKINFNLKQFKYIIHRGKWITASGIMAYFSNQGTDIIIGRFLTTNALGFYQMAAKITLVPISEIHEIFNRVTFPVYTKIGGDTQRLKKAFLKSWLTIVFLAFIFSIAIFTSAPLLTAKILGSQWESITPHLRLMAVAGFLTSLGAPINPLLLATKKQHWLTSVTFAKVIVLGIIIIPFTLTWGISGAITALILSIIATLPPRYYFTHKIFKQSP